MLCIDNHTIVFLISLLWDSINHLEDTPYYKCIQINLAIKHPQKQYVLKESSLF